MNQYILCKGKIPVDIAGHAIDPHQPSNWMSREKAEASAALLGLSIGFVFTSSDPYWFTDIDHCIVDGQINPIGQQLLDTFKGAYVETSTGGDGLHIFGRGEVPDHAKKNKEYGIEFYNDKRFVLLTGTNATGSWDIDWTPQIAWLVNTYFPPKVVEAGDEWRDTPVPEWNGPEDDDVLIGKICSTKGSAAQAFGGKATVSDLFTGNVEALAKAYPAIGEGHYDGSSADAALASHLSFWTGKNHERINRIMRRSALVRDKWDHHKSYMPMTITNAVSGCRDVYQAIRQDKPTPTTVTPIPESDTSTAQVVQRTGSQFMSTFQQAEYFKDCVYVVRSHGVLTPNGTIMSPEVFKASYAGYTFALDATNDKTTTNPWDAFINNQAITFPRVDGVCFRPKELPRAIIREEGLTMINSYAPITVKRMTGDPAPFLNLVHKLLPNKHDRDIVLAFMAAMVQHVGIKFQWCPILQGGEGNGKTLLFRVVERAIGSRFTHYPNFSDGNALKFNGWIEGKLAVFVEEVFVSDRREVTEPLKVFVTNERLEIQHKGGNQFTGDNFANIMMATNHKDAMKLTLDQRRYFMVFTAQQTEADLIRDGMDGRYFRELYEWLRGDGFAIMAEYLATYDIPDELNPAVNSTRAPKSSSIHDIVRSSLGNVEQHILESVEEDRQGFRGGYISSKCLNDLLVSLKLDNKISPYKRKAILESLGYVRHPWLRKGRVDNTIGAEGMKSILYYKGSPGSTQFSPIWVKEDYELKQGYINQPLQVVK